MDYKPEDWISSWAMNCKYKDQISITLCDTGNCNSIYGELPALDKAISLTDYGSSIAIWCGGFYSGDINKYVLLGLGGAKHTDADAVANITYEMTLNLASVHLHIFSRQTNSSTLLQLWCWAITSASYTRIECDLSRNLCDPNYTHICLS
jgi:hypothetical protein